MVRVTSGHYGRVRPATTPLYIGLAGVARLAGVQRPVASMWRSRFAQADDPFPAPAKEQNGRQLFDARDVARWLERTAHGHNIEAVADVATSAAPEGFDVADRRHVDIVDALLTLRAASGRAVGTGADLAERARLHDPDDAFLTAELSQVEPGWADWADVLADAAYSPGGGARVLEKRHAATRSADGSAGPLTAVGDELLVALAAALGTPTTHLPAPPAVHLGGGVTPALATALLHAVGDDAEARVDETAGGRRIRRRLLCEGMPVGLHPADGERLTVLRLPSEEVADASSMLRALDELALSLAVDDRAIVLAPATVLIDALASADDGMRSAVLRTGRVRAVVRLGAGLVTTAPREALGVWVLGAPVGDVPIAERYTAVADLTDAEPSPAARADLASDVRAAMGSAREVRAHAFRFARLVRTTALLAARDALVDAADRRSRGAGVNPGDLPALVDQAYDGLAADAPVMRPTGTRADSPPAARVDALLADGHLRVLAGTRVNATEFTATGLVAVTADDLDDTVLIGRRRLDPLQFAAQHPSARLTSPGDVVFRTAPTPRAWVDLEGSKVVVYPARVLRITAADPGGLVPELVAADIAQARGGAGSWRRWMLRRVAPAGIAPLRAALGELAARRAELRRRLDALDTYTDLLTSGVAAGTVTLTDDAAAAASDPQ